MALAYVARRPQPGGAAFVMCDVVRQSVILALRVPSPGLGMRLVEVLVLPRVAAGQVDDGVFAAAAHDRPTELARHLVRAAGGGAVNVKGAAHKGFSIPPSGGTAHALVDVLCERA